MVKTKAETMADRKESLRPLVPAPMSADEAVAESARRGEARARASAAEATAKAAPAADVKTDKVGVPVARSGGPLYPDPKKGPVNSMGKEPVHPPDLADNPTGPASPRRGAFGGFPPRPITDMEDEEEIVEKIRMTEKADVLYTWKAQEKASSKPRQNVIDALNARLNYVQGPPLPPD